MQIRQVFYMGPEIHGPPKPATGRKIVVPTVFHTDRVEVGKQVIHIKPMDWSKEARGRASWRELHTVVCDDPTPERVRRWEATIPCGECKKGYRKLVADHPFDYSTPDAFFVSTVNLHNAVNQKLIDAGDTSKRIVSIEEARQVWNRPAPTDRA